MKFGDDSFPEVTWILGLALQELSNNNNNNSSNSSHSFLETRYCAVFTGMIPLNSPKFYEEDASFAPILQMRNESSTVKKLLQVTQPISR